MTDATLNGPGPRLPAEFVKALGGLEWATLKADQKLRLWSAWAEANNVSARTPNPAANRVVAPVPGPHHGLIRLPLEVQRLQAELAEAESRPEPQAFTARRMRDSRIAFLRHKLDAARKRTGWAT